MSDHKKTMQASRKTVSTGVVGHAHMLMMTARHLDSAGRHATSRPGSGNGNMRSTGSRM